MTEIRLEAQDVVESGFNFIVGGYEYSNPTVTVSHVSAYCNSGSVYDRFSGYCGKHKYYKLLTHLISGIRITVVLSYIKKYLTRLEELIIVEPWQDNHHFSQLS